MAHVTAGSNANGGDNRHDSGSNHPAPTSAPVDLEMVDLDRLTHLCGALVARAGERIRAVHRKRLAGKSIGVVYKDASDVRSALTEADKAAQAAIVPALRAAFPTIAVVGEEDSDDEGEPLPDDYDDNDGGGKNNNNYTSDLGLGSAPSEAVSVFVDPVDATLEFVQGNLSAVQTLAGVCVHGRPIAGAISQPFAADAPVILVSVPRQLRCGLEAVARIYPERAQGAVIAAVSKRPKGIIADVLDIIAPAEIVELGGAGNKLMRIAIGEADIVVLNLVTSLWDTAATEALVRAGCGHVTDFFGCPLPHGPKARLSNRYGVIATSADFQSKDVRGRNHRELCADIRNSMLADHFLQDTGFHCNSDIPQATDITRNLDSNPITLEFLQNCIDKQITRFSAPESAAVRYLMSDACRIQLEYGGNDNSDKSRPKSVFYKRVVMADLPHVQLKLKTAPQKLYRDVTSYQVEAAFLNSTPVADFVKSGANIARPYHVEIRKGNPVIESKFALLLEDFAPLDGWKQHGLLDEQHIKAALDSLAKLHAYFWGNNNNSDMEDIVWKEASYWAPERQPMECFDRIEGCWKKHYENFGVELEKLENKVLLNMEFPLKALGTVLQKHALKTAQKVHAVGGDVNHPHRTICHGDGKAANFFFRKIGHPDNNNNTIIEVGNIDFQWTGYAHPALDVAYLISTSAHPDILAREKDLVRYYLQCLRKYLVKYDKIRNTNTSSSTTVIEEDAFTAFYEDCFIDLARLVISYHWDRINANPEVLESRKDKLGSNSYNKNLECAMWLVEKTWDILSRWEAGGDKKK